MTAEDERLARASRLIRRRVGVTQASGPTSRWITQEVEGGRAGQLKVDVVRRYFARLGAKAQLNISWEGAALDRLLDERHAQVVDAVARVLRGYGFQVMTEYSFNDYGDRGSIDVFGASDEARAVFVGEAKSEWGSLEETLRRQDVKRRLAPKLAAEAFGWSPQAIANVLAFPDESTARRIAVRYNAALGGYPARSREVRAWLRQPTGNFAGIWFLSTAGLDRHGNADSG